MNCLEVSRTDIELLNLLNKLDESRDHYDICLAQGDQRAAQALVIRIMELAKEIDNVIVKDEPARLTL